MSEHAAPIEALLATIHTLRSPGGCPWDQKQSLVDAARYLLDEAAELLDATLADDPEATIEELGDLLFMLCFCTRILSETHAVTFADVADQGNRKLIRRHPHVFGDNPARDTAESQQRWNEIKAQEKREKGFAPDDASVLKDLPAACAPLHQAYVYQDNAADVGFDWPDIGGVWDKIDEELEEVREAAGSDDRQAIEHEVGDLLFAVTNLARRLRVQPDLALRKANTRFKQRFGHIENHFMNISKPIEKASLDEMESIWQQAKTVDPD